MNEFHYLAMNPATVTSDENNEDDEDDYQVDKKKENKEDKKTTESKEKRRRILHNKHLIDCGKYLLSKGTDIKASSETGITPLLLALDNGNKEFALWLMENGASPLGKLNAGENLFFVLAANIEKYGIKKILKQLKKSSKKDLEELKESINSISDNGEGYNNKHN